MDGACARPPRVRRDVRRRPAVGHRHGAARGRPDRRGRRLQGRRHRRRLRHGRERARTVGTRIAGGRCRRGAACHRESPGEGSRTELVSRVPRRGRLLARFTRPAVRHGARLWRVPRLRGSRAAGVRRQPGLGARARWRAAPCSASAIGSRGIWVLAAFRSRSSAIRSPTDGTWWRSLPPRSWRTCPEGERRPGAPPSPGTRPRDHCVRELTTWRVVAGAGRQKADTGRKRLTRGASRVMMLTSGEYRPRNDRSCPCNHRRRHD